ncbi:Cinnamoyl-CoA reductase [Melia azedarach]|uniref:Cinnamoyl-CoA reductase n=1 Tax=Melia azedarach TaxID=155640 RepID=A0ACC1WTH1_MELAZ|nr:Cinnamoyl-CoA reductase [Melia azedarach]
MLSSENFAAFSKTPTTNSFTEIPEIAVAELAGGYPASWVIKLLLSRNYVVHGTVRELSDEKNAHLYELEKASENLKLFKSDLLDYNSLYSAIAGCDGVFHVASPVPSTTVPNPEVELIEPAVKEYCRTTNKWYCLSKTEAESEALEFAKRTGLDVVTVCPTLVLGPLLQSKMNASSLVLIKLLREGYESLENKLRLIVDVRDVAEALLLAYEKPEAEGRYICAAHMIKAHELVDKLKSKYPSYNYPKSFTEVAEEQMLSSEKLQKLGWSYGPLDETLIDSESYKKAELLD